MSPAICHLVSRPLELSSLNYDSLSFSPFQQNRNVDLVSFAVMFFSQLLVLPGVKIKFDK